MKKIVVIGNSIAGVKALETIRGFDVESDLTIFALDGFYPYNRDLFPDYFLKKIKESKIFYPTGIQPHAADSIKGLHQPKEFYEQNRINVILERQISRINFKNKRIFTPEKDQIDFDVLIIADTHQVRFPDIQGTGKTGVFALRKLSDLKKIIMAIPLVETVVIETNSPQGLRMADAFKEQGKEVIVLDNAVTEILGDAEVKAVRLKSGKVLAAEMVIFAEASPDLRLFADTDLKIDQRILIDSSFRTNIEGVFAFPPMARFKEEEFNTGDLTSTTALEEAGKTIAANIAGQDVSKISLAKRRFVLYS